jgi:hypothetical protein
MPVIMAVRLTDWQDLAFLYEEVDNETGEFRQASFAAFDADGNALLWQVESNQKKHDPLVTLICSRSHLLQLGDNRMGTL